MDTGCSLEDLPEVMDGEKESGMMMMMIFELMIDRCQLGKYL